MGLVSAHLAKLEADLATKTRELAELKERLATEERATTALWADREKEKPHLAEMRGAALDAMDVRAELHDVKAQLAESRAEGERLRGMVETWKAVNREMHEERDSLRTQFDQAQQRIAECGAVVEAVREYQALASDPNADLDAETQAQRRVLSVPLPEKVSP